MKLPSVSLILAAGMIALSAAPGLSESSTSAHPNFTCEMRDGIPTTVKYSSENNQTGSPMLRWQSKYFPGETALQQCQQAAAKFQSYYGSNLDSLATGIVAGKPEVCFVDYKNTSGCTASAPVLFTLKATDNPEQVLYALLDSSVKKSTLPAIVRGDNPTHGRRSLFFGWF